jgi:hypothetical protein
MSIKIMAPVKMNFPVIFDRVSLTSISPESPGFFDLLNCPRASTIITIAPIATHIRTIVVVVIGNTPVFAKLVHNEEPALPRMPVLLDAADAEDINANISMRVEINTIDLFIQSSIYFNIDV